MGKHSKQGLILCIILLLIILVGCTSNLKTQDNKNIEQSKKDIVSFGVISDIHADISNLNYFMETFNNEPVDVLLVLGDTNYIFENVEGNSDYEEMYHVLKIILGNFKNPVFIIPGNHEPKEDYLALKGNLKKEFPNQQFTFLGDTLSNMQNNGDTRNDIQNMGETLGGTQHIISFKGVMLIFIPGYHLKGYMHPLGGFLFNESFFDELQTERDVFEIEKEFNENKNDDNEKNKDSEENKNKEIKNNTKENEIKTNTNEHEIKAKLLVAHGPPKGKSKDSIDAIFSGENVGNELINDFMMKNNIKFGAFGHIHEAGMNGVDENDNFVDENIWSDSLFINPGSATKWKMNSGKESKGSAGILEINVKEERARYKIITVK